MGARYWKPGGPLLLMLPNVTALLLLTGAFLLLNGPPVAIRTSAIKLNRGLLPERLDKTRNCSRPCLDGIKPKECYFKLVLEPSVTLNSNCSRCGNNKEERPCVYGDGVERMMLAVNRRLPGTPMQVCEGDVVVVDVENYLPGLETSLHWHGQVQRGTPYMDGVPMITQCPIQSGTRFRYKFRASNPGTHFYHSHFVSHHADGIFGPFIVRQSRSREVHYKMYDHDLDEHVITIAPWTHSLLAYNLDFQENLKISTLLINGRGNFHDLDKRTKTEVPKAQFAVKLGKRYRFRLINAASLDCPVHLQIDKHNLTIIATDGSAVKPMIASHLILYPGERYDVILEANQQISSYWMKVIGHHMCANIQQDALLIYDSAAVTNQTNNNNNNMVTTTSVEIDSDLKLRSLGNKSYPELQSTKADKTLFVPFDVFSFDNLDDKDINFNFTLEDLPYYPSYLYNTKRPVKLPQINGVTFAYPSSPLLSQPEDVSHSAYCEERCKLSAGFCECLNTLHVPLNVSLDIVLIDQGNGSNESTTFHLHGYKFHVLSSKSLGQPVHLADIKNMESQGRLARNLENPPMKDTVVVPNKGYVILRLVTNNPGLWLFEARTTSPVTSEGMQFVLHVGEQYHLPSVPPNFPRCGTLKGPNFIF